jgi:hypothetical protein
MPYRSRLEAIKAHILEASPKTHTPAQIRTLLIQLREAIQIEGCLISHG